MGNLLAETLTQKLREKLRLKDSGAGAGSAEMYMPLKINNAFAARIQLTSPGRQDRRRGLEIGFYPGRSRGDGYRLICFSNNNPSLEMVRIRRGRSAVIEVYERGLNMEDRDRIPLNGCAVWTGRWRFAGMEEKSFAPWTGGYAMTLTASSSQTGEAILPFTGSPCSAQNKHPLKFPPSGMTSPSSTNTDLVHDTRRPHKTAFQTNAETIRKFMKRRVQKRAGKGWLMPKCLPGINHAPSRLILPSGEE